MASIAIIGSGFVGQATGKGLAKHNNTITFFDKVPEKVNDLKKQGYQARLVTEGLRLNSDIIMVTVPTPTVGDNIDLGMIREASEWIGRSLAGSNKYQLVVIRSTVPPKTTEEVVLPILESKSNKKAGEAFGLAMQPEYLRQATSEADFARPWFVLIGEYDKKSGDILEELYSPFNPPKIERCSLSEAEMQKYIHNVFNAHKIAFFNEMREICKKENWDHEKLMLATAESCEGIWNPIYGLRDMGPFDGACLPKDTAAFHEWASSNEHDIEILASVISHNKKLANKLQVILAS